MQNLIDLHYQKETKITDAIVSRTPDATLLETSCPLKLVYDVYTNVDNDVQKDALKVNIIFLHGSGMNRVIWEYYVAHLSQYMNKNEKCKWKINKIVSLDQVSHGDSYLLNENYIGVNFDWGDGARDACKVAQEEFLSPRCPNSINVIVGHSMGGFQALASGVLFPHLFDVIIPIEPVVYVPHVKNKKNITIVPPRFYNALWSKMTDSFKNRQEYEEFFYKKSFYTKVQPEILKRLIDFEAIHDGDGTVRTKMVQKQNILCYLTLSPTAAWLIKSLQLIKSPVYGIEGGVSTWCPPTNQEILVKFLPEYHKDVIKTGDHLVNIEMPDECLARVVDYITKFIEKRDNKNAEHSPVFLSNEERRQLFNKKFEEFRKERVRDGNIELAKF